MIAPIASLQQKAFVGHHFFITAGVKIVQWTACFLSKGKGDFFLAKSPRPYSGPMCTKEDAAEDLGFSSFDKVYIECLFLEHHKYGGGLAVGGKGSLESWLINFPMMLSPPKHLQDGINLKYR